MSHKIFVVIVNYHSEEKVKLLKAQLPGLEIIVIDNNVKNVGFAGGANAGIEKALSLGASKIFLVNPDISVTADQIFMLAASKFDIVGPVIKFKRKTKTVLDYGGKINLLLGRPWHVKNKPSKKIDFVTGACMGIDIEVIKKIGFFDYQYFMYFEDADFCLRAKKAGLSVGLESNVIVEHDLETHKLTKNKKKMRLAWNSNKIFVEKWVPWYFKPLAWMYLVWLWSKISL